MNAQNFAIEAPRYETEGLVKEMSKEKEINKEYKKWKLNDDCQKRIHTIAKVAFSIGFGLLMFNAYHVYKLIPPVLTSRQRLVLMSVTLMKVGITLVCFDRERVKRRAATGNILQCYLKVLEDYKNKQWDDVLEGIKTIPLEFKDNHLHRLQHICEGRSINPYLKKQKVTVSAQVQQTNVFALDFMQIVRNPSFYASCLLNQIGVFKG